MILLIDNYDSFTYNLFQFLRELGAAVEVRRNDKIDAAGIAAARPGAIVISPGPGRPDDGGVSKTAIERFGGEIPILGVCLGHQAIGEVFGARVVAAKKLMHGKTSRVSHDGKTIFAGLPAPLTVMRYHSLTLAAESIPDCFEISATNDEDGEIMAMRHREARVGGRAVSSRIDHDRARARFARQFFAPLRADRNRRRGGGERRKKMSETTTTAAPFAGKTALVTGVSRGIGAAILAALADGGAFVVGTATGDSGLGLATRAALAAARTRGLRAVVCARRRIDGGGRFGRGGEGAIAERSRRYFGEQRRANQRRLGDADERRRLARGRASQFGRRVLFGARGFAGDAEKSRRANRQFVFYCGVARQRRPSQLLRGEGGHRGAHAGVGARGSRRAESRSMRSRRALSTPT